MGQKRSEGNEGSFLDFLYPAGTISLLRNYSGWGVDRQDIRWARNGLKFGQRLYTSSATDSPAPDQIEDPMSVEKASRSDTEVEGVDLVGEKMGITKSNDYEEAWRQYLLLEENDRKMARKQLVAYYATSNRVIDAERTIDLFEQMDTEDRDPVTIQRTVRAHLRLCNLQDALLLYKNCLETREIPAGADELLAYLVNLSLWSRACNIWSDIQHLGQKYPQRSYNIFTYVENLPSFRGLICDLAVYVNERIPEVMAAVGKRPGGSSKIASYPTVYPPGLASFAVEMARVAMLKEQSFSSATFLQLLDHLQKWNCVSYGIFDQIHRLLLSLNEPELLVKCYLKVRKEASNKIFSYQSLHTVLKTFCLAHDVRGIQWVLDDFSRYYTKPSRQAYRECMKEFAAQGDAAAVHKLFDQFIAHYTSEERPLWSSKYLTPILQVHSKRGEIEKVLQVFNDISSKYQLKLSTTVWNILISAYGRVHDIDGAFACFERLLGSSKVKPNAYTIGTLMGICVQRGDLLSAIELYRLTDDLHIEKNAVMINSLVLAHVQDDRLTEAERICREAVTMNVRGDLTRMWNYLIVAYARRRDLKSANRILQLMSSLNVGYDEFTYGALMQSLAMVRQPDQALKIMDSVLPAAGHRPTPFHYAIVMGGFIANGNFWNVNKLYTRYSSQFTRNTSSINAMLLRAQVKKDEKLSKMGPPQAQSQRSMEMFLEIVSSLDPQDVSDSARKSTPRDPLDIAYATSMYSYMMYILAQNRDAESVRQLHERYISSIPPNRRAKPPIAILSALARMKWHERDLAGVEECWKLALAAAQDQGRPLSLPVSVSTNNDLNDRNPLARRKILYVHNLDLSVMLSWYLEALAQQGHVDKMILTIDNFINDGFTPDVRNWNLYIRLLCQNKRPKLAFMTCERHLMPNWTGWARIRRDLPVRNRLPLDIRAKRKDSRWIRPTSYTLTILARHYIDIQASSWESRRNQVLLLDLGRLCPKTVSAIKTMQRSNEDSEREVLERF